MEKVQRYNMPSEKGELNSYLEEDLKEKVIFELTRLHLECTGSMAAARLIFSY